MKHAVAKRPRSEGTSRRHSPPPRELTPPPPAPVVPRFHSVQAENLFNTLEFEIMGCRYLNTAYFTSKTPQLMELFTFYNLGILMSCTHDINVDLCKEFYVNLRQIGGDQNRYESTVGGTVIEFNPDILQAFLQCRQSQNPFVTYPNPHGIITGSFRHISADTIHRFYFDAPRSPLRNIFEHTGMSAIHYVWYHMILDCILPIVTRGRSLIRFPHLIMMYALEHRLDIDIALNVFASIIYHSAPSQGKLHLPFCHILTAFFASRGIDVSKGQIKKLKKSYDCLGSRQLRLAKIEYHDGAMRWAHDIQAPAAPADPDAPAAAEEGALDPPEDAAAPDAPASVPAPVSTSEERLTRIEQILGDLHGEFLLFRQDVRVELQTMRQEILGLLRGQQAPQASTPPPPPPADDA